MYKAFWFSCEARLIVISASVHIIFLLYYFQGQWDDSISYSMILIPQVPIVSVINICLWN